MPDAKQAARAGGSKPRALRVIFPAGLEQVRALSHPLRLRLLELFADRVRTTKQAAEVMGEAPTRLYHHVAALERAGLVRVRETRRVRGATEKYFEVVTGGLDPSRTSTRRPRAGDRDNAALGLMLFGQARNELVRALAGRAGGRRPDILAARGVIRLSPKQAAKLRVELTSLLQSLGCTPGGEDRPARGGLRRYSLTIALVPAEPEAD
jgi:DNA-binding transcriptional ArsR family regulator